MKLYTSIALLAASVGLFFLFIKPHYEQINVLRGQSRQYDNALLRAEEISAKRDRLLDRRNSFNSVDVERLQRFLPDNIDNIRLLVDVSNMAARYGSPIQSISISEQNIQDPSVIGPDTKPYGTLTLGFNVSMPYDQFKKFLADIERSLRLTNIVSVSFKPAEQSSIYDFTLKLNTYWLK